MNPERRARSGLSGKAASARRQEAAAARREHSIERSRQRREAARVRQRASIERAREARRVTLLDLLDRLLDGGVLIHGDITLAVADVDLLYVGLRAMVASVETIERELGVSLTARGASLRAAAL
jgi:acetyl-CoA carboxylase alpha subunit